MHGTNVQKIKEKLAISVTKTNQLGQYSEIFTLFSEIGTDYRNTLCGQKVECLGMEKLGSHGTDLNDILYLSIFPKFL
jgi:hypothetical protein